MFEVFLKSAGSYENAKETERDILTCDENEFAQTKDMLYGVYTVKQTSGWEGRELMKAFDVFINSDSQTYRYLINKQLLKGGYGFMCQYDNEPDFETVWSSIFDLDSLVIYRAEGDPRKKKFVTDSRLHALLSEVQTGNID